MNNQGKSKISKNSQTLPLCDKVINTNKPDMDMPTGKVEKVKHKYNFAVSICMIVKNEEKNLQRCLDSFLPIIQIKDDNTLERLVELIIIDTGSTDRTFNIAKKYTDKVYKREVIPWHFSKARNIGIKMATGKKILILDADDELQSGKNIYQLMNLLLNPMYDHAPTTFIKIHNIYNKKGQHSSFKQPRIFLNIFEPIYSGIVHNKPVTYTPYLFANNVIFKNWSYMFEGDPELKKQKNTDRTLPMLLKELETDPDNMHYMTHLVKAYHVDNDTENVIKTGEKWIRLFKTVPYHDGWYAYLDCFLHIAAAYINGGNIREALRVKEELEKYSKRLAQIYFIIGNYYVVSNIDKAAEYFEYGLEICNTKFNDYEGLMTSNVKMAIPSIYNWLATYYFTKSNYDKAGDYLNKGIKSDVFKTQPRWDIWNETIATFRLKD